MRGGRRVPDTILLHGRKRELFLDCGCARDRVGHLKQNTEESGPRERALHSLSGRCVSGAGVGLGLRHRPRCSGRDGAATAEAVTDSCEWISRATSRGRLSSVRPFLKTANESLRAGSASLGISATSNSTFWPALEHAALLSVRCSPLHRLTQAPVLRGSFRRQPKGDGPAFLVR